mmetsp:Transcript_48938/g.118496  ORF Transcript_48938/g.118496 Transcript_48938/m.118496 type:complete len:95 (+) Transcript_48938:913-1197(+)
MQAWGKDQKVGLSMLQLMADPESELTRALDMELTHPGPIGKGLINRCKRHAIYAVDGKIKAVNVAESENDPAGDEFPEVTLADAMIEAIRKSKE